nr:MAG TPA: hypothetical protein [Microviridae sp.]
MFGLFCRALLLLRLLLLYIFSLFLLRLWLFLSTSFVLLYRFRNILLPKICTVSWFLPSLLFLILLYHMSIGFSLIFLFCNKIVTFSCNPVLLLCFEWRFSALPCVAHAELG